MKENKSIGQQIRKYIPAALGIAVLGLFVWTGIFLFKKSNKPAQVYKTETPVTTDIIKKTIATGTVMPRREIAIKPRVSGVVDKIFIQPGEYVKEGQLLAKIKIIPNSLNLSNAESNLNKARIAFEQNKKELERQEKLFKEKLIPEIEYNQYVVNYKRSEEELLAAENQFQIVKEGTSRYGSSTTLIHSTVSGMVLDVPVREGTSVIESNNFNDGTTIALIADMNEMIFSGKVDESEVEKIKEGMNLLLTIGAIESKKYNAKLEFISPKGVTDQGTIQFEIRAAIQLDKGDFLRSGYSANADIILDKKEKVLAINESLLQFGKDSVFVEVEKAPQVFEKRLVKTGLSDGINVEVVSGIAPNEKLKVVLARGEDEPKPKTPEPRGGGVRMEPSRRR